MTSIVKAIARNPIKSSIAAAAAGYGANWYRDYHLTMQKMKSYCLLAAKLGDQHIYSPTADIKHVTVILNPKAGTGKSKRLYEKWVEPLFQLAGLKVRVIETESESQAYELMNLMSNTHCVAIVGGDGTVHEAIRGLLDRPDASKYGQRLPVGIIPAGKSNLIASHLHQGTIEYRNEKEFMIETAMAFIRCRYQLFISEQHAAQRLKLLLSTLDFHKG